MKFIKSNWKVFLLVVIGLFLRLYKYDQLFMYSHDQDLAGWIIKDIVVDKHFRLIGQETSTQGIFIGGFFYYLQIPFYLLFRMDPIGITFLGAVLGILYIIGIYKILSSQFSDNVGFIGALIYTVSFAFVFNDREIVPTQPVIFWSFAMFWVVLEVLKGNFRRGLVVCAVLTALIWHFNFALILALPLVVLSVIFSDKKVKLSDIAISSAVFVILSIPLLYFELRHGFVQSRAFMISLTTNQKDIISGYDKFVRIYHLISKNYYSIFLPVINFINYELVSSIIIGVYFYLLFKIKKYRKILLILFLWFLIYFIFFSLYSKRVSEYYLSGIQFIPVVLLSILFAEILKNRKFRIVGIIILGVFTFINLKRFFTIPINRSGYLERKEVVHEIKNDSIKHGYECVSVSYITNPGYELGYRYFFWLEKLHVNNPSSNSPVYTIVFPLNDRLFPANKTFGAIGLIYPDYSRYTKDDITKSCSGENSNLTDPMFGFTN